ncbi:type IV pilin [Steroidobacter agaridevorans]|uniref:Type IV pilin n=1 Tax=Steroidobacter agaridevorans TaxID=2695856 RepID=A0A829YFY7_9GAMM|nr:type IV pilin protein [Steroidobacter agaridevorans]GFE81833.1 type IV pilin [Steroidobacter agaridevorans]GFE90578.1 type IV pilin [Steroidobacter agaridevorans]
MSYEPMRRRAAGMTLIELMVVMAIVAILAAIAYPSYRSHIAKTHRKAAAACLSQHAHFMERYYTTNLSYEGAEPDLGCKTESDLDRFYTFPEPEIDGRSYTVTAVPTDSQDATDPNHCGELSLDQTGDREPKNDACW